MFKRSTIGRNGFVQNTTANTANQITRPCITAATITPEISLVDTPLSSDLGYVCRKVLLVTSGHSFQFALVAYDSRYESGKVIQST